MPTNSAALEANVISYSGPRWTNEVSINGNGIYNLSNYNMNFLQLGDPYRINIPTSFIQANNSIFLNTGLSASNTSSGSLYNAIIYKISKATESYTSISAKAEGCNWNIPLSNSILSVPIPSNYSGAATCNYTIGGEYFDTTDAVQIAVYNILKSLDLNLDGKIDIELSQENIQISTSDLEGVPWHYSTEVQVRKWY